MIHLISEFDFILKVARIQTQQKQIYLVYFFALKNSLKYH